MRQPSSSFRISCSSRSSDQLLLHATSLWLHRLVDTTLSSIVFHGLSVSQLLCLSVSLSVCEVLEACVHFCWQHCQSLVQHDGPVPGSVDPSYSNGSRVCLPSLVSTSIKSSAKFVHESPAMTGGVVLKLTFLRRGSNVSSRTKKNLDICSARARPCSHSFSHTFFSIPYLSLFLQTDYISVVKPLLNV